MSQTPTPGELLEIRRVKAMVAGAGGTINPECFLGPQGPPGPAGPTGPAGPPGGAVNLPSTPNAVVFIDNQGTISLGTTDFTYISANGLYLNNTLTVTKGITGYMSTFSIVSSLQGLGTLSYISSPSLTSSLQGLGSLGYLSSATAATGFASTVAGLGTASYISSLSLTSSLQGLGTLAYLSSAIQPSNLASTVAGIGTASYISSLSLTSSLQGLGTASYISSPSLTSSLQGLGSLGYISSGVTQPSLTSTVAGLGSTGYFSSLSTASVVAFAPRLGNVLVVDQVNGNDSLGFIGGTPFKTIQGAISAASVQGVTIWVLPGTYSLPSGITLPSGTSLRGLSLQTTTIQMLNVTQDTTLVTMGSNSRLEDVTLRLTSQSHYNLTGVLFPGTTSVNAKLRTAVVTVDNSNASSGGGSGTVVAAIVANGTGTLGTASFTFNALKGSTANVYSNGAGNKRGLLCSGPNVITTRDMNFYCAPPSDSSSTGSYIALETNNASGQIQCRATTCGGPSTILAGTTYTYSDILQTAGELQIGPGTDMVNKRAGGQSFKTYVYPTTIFYGIKGLLSLSGITSGYLWPGSFCAQQASGQIQPYPDTTIAYYRIQQSSILSGMSIYIETLPNSTNTLTITIYKNGSPLSGFSITFTSSSSRSQTYYGSSVDYVTGDFLSVGYVYTNSPTNTVADITVQVDLF